MFLKQFLDTSFFSLFFKLCFIFLMKHFMEHINLSSHRCTFTVYCTVCFSMTKCIHQWLHFNVDVNICVFFILKCLGTQTLKKQNKNVLIFVTITQQIFISVVFLYGIKNTVIAVLYIPPLTLHCTFLKSYHGKSWCSHLPLKDFILKWKKTCLENQIFNVLQESPE